MTEAVQRYLSPGSRQKIYLILVFLSIVLLFYSIWQVYPVVVNITDPLGMASQLPPWYWVGLALIVLVSIFAFLDGEIKKDAIFILILIVLGLFLFGVRTLFAENTGDPTAYSPLGDVRTLLASHHIDITNPPHGDIQTYYSWPAFHFINASILEISGVTFSFIKYMPLFFLLCFVSITYAIGKRFELPSNRCFLLSFLALSSWLIGFAGFYYPRMYAMLLFLLLFMLLLTPQRTVAETIAAVLIFSAAILTHGMFPMVLIPGLVLLAIYRRDIRFVALFIVIFGAWYMYQCPLALESGVRTLSKPLFDILHLAQVERYQEPTLTLVLAVRYSRFAYLISYVALMAGSAILLLGRRITGEYRKQVIALFTFAIGVSLALVLGFGEQAYRTYLYCVVPAASIAVLTVLSFSRRKIVTALTIFLMCLFVAAHLPANYGGEAQWGQVLTSELRGTEHFALRVKPAVGTATFYTYATQLAFFHNPDLRGTVAFPSSQTVYNTYVHLQKKHVPIVSPLEVLDRYYHIINYVIISNQGEVAYWEDWPQTEGGKEAYLIYNNGNLQIYDNHNMP